MKKRRTKASQKRLNNLLIILVLTAVLMVMSTYAWFTANRTVTIEALNVKATTTNGLQISSGTSTWSNIMKVTDLANASKAATTLGVTDMLGYNFNNASTNFDLQSDGKLQFYLGSATQTEGGGQYVLTTRSAYEFNTNGLITNTSSSEVVESVTLSGITYTADFMAFDFFLKYTGAESPLYCSADITPGTYDKGAQNAARVAFVIGSENESNSSDGTVENENFTSFSTSGGRIVAFEPNNTAHTVNSITSNGASGIGYGTISNGTAYDHYGITGATTSEVSLVNCMKGLIAPASSTLAKNISGISYTTSANTIATVQTGTIKSGITKVRCYIWIEGQDVDCENGATGGDMNVAISFSLDPII